MDKCVVVLSGGMDSTALLYEMRQRYLCLAMSVDYAQRHGRELEHAQRIAYGCGVPWQRVDLRALSTVIGTTSSQLNPALDVPEGHYADPSMRVTVVPNRNMILLAVAAGFAVDRGAKRIAYAAHAGDHAIYPDCRPAFVDAMHEALRTCHYDGGVQLLAPYLTLSKADVVKRGDKLGVPWAATWSCYKGALKHCGRCGTCVERREAFVLAGVPDPTDYA